MPGHKSSASRTSYLLVHKGCAVLPSMHYPDWYMCLPNNLKCYTSWVHFRFPVLSSLCLRLWSTPPRYRPSLSDCVCSQNTTEGCSVKRNQKPDFRPKYMNRCCHCTNWHTNSCLLPDCPRDKAIHHIDSDGLRSKFARPILRCPC